MRSAWRTRIVRPACAAVMRMITRVKQQNPDLPEDEIYFGGPIVVAGEKLQMGDGDTIRIELYEGGAPVAHLNQANNSIKNVVSIPTAIAFSINNNGSTRPDMHLCRRHQVPRRATRGALRKQSRKRVRDWWGKDVLLTATIGGIPTTRWLKFHDPEA